MTERWTGGEEDKGQKTKETLRFRGAFESLESSPSNRGATEVSHMHKKKIKELHFGPG